MFEFFTVDQCWNTCFFAEFGDIYFVLWGGGKQDICYNISQIYDTLALNILMLILKGRLPFRQLWLNWSFSDDSIKGRTIPEGIALDMFTFQGQPSVFAKMFKSHEIEIFVPWAYSWQAESALGIALSHISRQAT